MNITTNIIKQAEANPQDSKLNKNSPQEIKNKKDESYIK